MEQISIKSNNTNAKPILRLRSTFQRVNRVFVLSFENNADKTVHTKYYSRSVEIKDYNVMINGKNFFHQPVKKIN